ncbi:MAG TPA: nicotinate-nucleotide adenylyltransferase [Pyrinomonadaceae bacterium]|nr:nicotinate-nucleotide adenylyltransferase [Pyrinomonadaceae bacterium]
MERRRRIALYGGTFDPVHVGHTALARRLLEQFSLDEVLFIPAHVAPHKRDREVSPALHRYAMLALATQGEERFRVSTVELDAPESPYTVGTLERFVATTGREARLFFVMGADSWQEITTWREWERVLTLTDIVVVTRPGYEVGTSHVTPSIRERVVDLRRGRGSFEEALKEEAGGTRIYLSDAVVMDVSATGVRRAARDGAELGGMVAPPVAEYIRKYGLYQRGA